MTEDVNAVCRVAARRIRDGAAVAVEDVVAAEVPVALVYNGLDHAVMMATPADLDDFALGFSLSEGIIADAGQLFAVERTGSPAGITLRLTIAAEPFTAFRGRRRGIVGRTGCGLCGVERLDDLATGPRDLQATRVSAQAVTAAVAALPAHQTLNAACGGLHAAAFVTAEGQYLAVREDVGRHNALDKLVGSLARQASRPAGFVVLSSRASYEMVDKAARAGIALVVSVSAPTSLAVERAEAAGVTLISFARDDRFTIYSRADRISL